MAFSEIIDVIRDILKDPLLTPIYLALLIVFIGIFMWKYASTLEDKISNRLEKFFDDHNKKHEILDPMIPRIKFIDENFEVLKKRADEEKLNNNLSIYKYIEYETIDLKDRFIKNYNNGGIKEKAFQETSVTQKKLFSTLNTAMITSNNRKLISVLINFIIRKSDNLVDNLEEIKDNDPIFKISKINILFNSLVIIISFFHLKEIDFSLETEHNLIEILDKELEQLTDDSSSGEQNNPRLENEF